ncbi:hypothetical protein [Alkalihalobacterium chitinilyticum]|nr:hypothetical protein [Alkalihalobacterium chitinilyticum]
METISGLKADQEGQYYMYVFFDFPHDEVPPPPDKRGVVDDKLERQYEVYENMMRLDPLLKVHQFGVKSADRVPEQVDFLNIKEFPTFVIFDDKGVVFLSTDMSETEKFLETLPDIELKN